MLDPTVLQELGWAIHVDPSDGSCPVSNSILELWVLGFWFLVLGGDPKPGEVGSIHVSEELNELASMQHQKEP